MSHKDATFMAKTSSSKQRDQEVSRQQTLMATEELPNRAEDPPIVPEIGPLSPQVVPMASEVPPIVTIDSPIETKEPPIAFDDHDSNLLPQMAINLHRALPRAKKIYDDAPDSHYFLSGVTVKRDPDEPPRKMASEQMRPQPVNTFVRNVGLSRNRLKTSTKRADSFRRRLPLRAFPMSNLEWIRLAAHLSIGWSEAAEPKTKSNSNQNS